FKKIKSYLYNLHIIGIFFASQSSLPSVDPSSTKTNLINFLLKVLTKFLTNFSSK
ncbi:uncharacterized protein METZ01_LOCUS261347, partial [marine metagenome]